MLAGMLGSLDLSVVITVSSLMDMLVLLILSMDRGTT